MRTTFGLFLCSIAVSACSSTPEPSGELAAPRHVAIASTTTAAPGYVHSLGVSKFVVGTNPANVTEFGMQKVVGDQGVFSTHPSGMVLALPNANAAARLAGPLSGGAEAHNTAVEDYFVGAGLPADQILSVSAYPVVKAIVPTAGGHITPTLVYYNSIIKRQIGAVPVPDSYAWAQMNANGVAVAEGVFWPPIPAAAVTSAASFVTSLASSLQSYVGLLPSLPGAANGTVVIHHTADLLNQTLQATAAYDLVSIPPGGGLARILHFDSTGAPVTLPQEAPGAWGPSPANGK